MARTIGLMAPRPLRARLASALGTALDVVVADPPASAPRAAVDVVVAVDHAADPEALERTVAACAPRSLPVLRCAFRDGYIEVGPQFRGRCTACVSCLRRGQAADEPGLPGGVDADPVAVDVMRVALLRTASAMTAPAVERDAHRLLTRIDVASRRGVRYLVTPYPDCAACGVRAWPASGDAELVEAYEWQMERPPPEVAPAGVLPASAALWPPGQPAGNGRTPAPARGLPSGDDPPGPDGRVTVPVLAGLLRHTAGRRGDGTERRWAPTGGNLGSVELLLLAGDGLDLGATILRYDGNAHAVHGLSSPPLRRCLAGTDLRADLLIAAVVFVAAVGRLATRYGRFAYRLAHLDAGCAAMQLAAIADDYGLRVTLAAGWDERLPDVLGLDPVREPVTAIAGIHRTGVAPCR